MLPALTLLLPPFCCAPPRPDEALPWLQREGWRTADAWHDGKAEKAVYEAALEIYGQPRRYVAVAYTNSQHMDPRTGVKSEDGSGVEVFKHHWSERVPTERYDYDFSTAVFVRRADLAPFKLTAATQEDCGASFKQLWRTGDRLSWLESVYFPGAGNGQGELEAPGVQLADALPLVLRDFPFEQAEERARSGAEVSFPLRLLPSQKSTRRSSFQPVTAAVRFAGRETIELPAGEHEAFRLELSLDGDPGGGAIYWFAAAGEAPWLHVLLRYEGPGGASYRLVSLERTAYWKRD